jgi:hypothetical protein
MRGPEAPPFLRGDANGDGGLDLSDAIATLGCLFLGSACPECLDAADSNDDGEVDLSDAILTLGCLFLGSACPKPPFGACGVDPTPEDPLDCAAYRHCP